MTDTREEFAEWTVKYNAWLEAVWYKTNGVPEYVFDEWQAVAEQATKAERERCAKLCVDKANSLESKIEPDTDRDDISHLRSTAWMINNCAVEIRRGE